MKFAVQSTVASVTFAIQSTRPLRNERTFTLQPHHPTLRPRRWSPAIQRSRPLSQRPIKLGE